MKKLSVILALLLVLMMSGCGKQQVAMQLGNSADNTTDNTTQPISNAANKTSNAKTVQRSWSPVGGTPWSQETEGESILLNVKGQLCVGTVGAGVWSWDGSAWSQMGGPKALFHAARNVFSLAMVKDTLYAGTGDSVWSWDGSKWDWYTTALVLPASGHTPVGASLAAYKDTLYAGTEEGVWSWDGSEWFKVGGSGGLSKEAEYVLNLVAVNNMLYAGTWHDGVWSWNGSMWNSLGGPNANSLLGINGTLYAGTDSDGVMVWDGSAWSRLGGSAGLEGKASQVTSLLAVNDTLYAGTGNGVWSWDGSAWLQVGNSPTGFGDGVLSLAAINGTLYAGTLSSSVFSITIPNTSPSSSNAVTSADTTAKVSSDSQSNSEITQEKAASIITDYLLKKGISKDKDSNLVITLDRIDNTQGKEYFVFQIFDNMSDHTATIGWYGVQKNDGSLYDFTLMTPII